MNNSTYSYTATFDTDGQALDLTGTIASTSSAVGAAVSVVDSSTSHTGSFTIDADQTLGSLDATGGELNVAANLTVLSGLTVQGATVLQGTNPSTTITLSNGSPFIWESTVSGEFFGDITGSGSLNVKSPAAGAALTLGYSGYDNGYSGGTNVSGGQLVCNSGGAITPGTALTMSQTALVEIDGGSGPNLSSLSGGPLDTITNNTADSSAIIEVGLSGGVTSCNFSGTIKDGAGGSGLLGLALYESTFYIGNAYYSYGTDITGATVTFGGVYSSGFLASKIDTSSVTPGADSTVIFTVPGGSTVPTPALCPLARTRSSSRRPARAHWSSTRERAWIAFLPA